jgi:hypothetical protein
MNLRRTIRCRHAAYTMVELMAAVLISIVLVVAMYQIFARVQSVFTTGHSRTKLLEEGRAVMDLIVRDLSRMAPAGLLDPNFIAVPYRTNRLETLAYPTNWATLRADQQNTWLTTTEPFVSSRVSFLGHDDQWQQMAYRLESRGQPGKANDVIGALWRYESGPVPKRHIIRLVSSNKDGQYQKLSDNVVHFRMRAVSPHDPGRALWADPEFRRLDVPLYVEVEIGLIEEKLKKEILNDAKVERLTVELESGAMDQASYRRLTSQRRGRVMELLAENLGRILMLRQLVPIRTQSDIPPALFVKKTQKEFEANGFSVTGGVTGGGFPAGGSKPARYVFIIDKSGSMAAERRFISARLAMIETLKKLNPNAFFYVFFFSNDSEGMPSGPVTLDNPEPGIALNLVSATPANVAFYTRWVATRSYGGGTNPTRALEAAFAMNPDTIWLLTDGQIPDFIVPGIANLNAARATPVRVNTIGLGRSKDISERYLLQIAVDNEGVYTFVSTDPEEEE